jgi:hypothetical protein
MRSKRNLEAMSDHADRGANGPNARDRIRADLAARGVAPEFCEALSARLQSQVESFDAPSYLPLLDGVAAAYGVHEEASEALSSRLRELSEIERLMSSFAGELSKLDEVLNVLTAHVGRMRTSTPSTRVLH